MIDMIKISICTYYRDKIWKICKINNNNLLKICDEPINPLTADVRIKKRIHEKLVSLKSWIILHFYQRGCVLFHKLILRIFLHVGSGYCYV